MDGCHEKVVLAGFTLITDPETSRILIVHNRRGDWSLPGGAREQGETLAETAIRETAEEAGVTVKINKLVAVKEAKTNGRQPHAVFFRFAADIVEGTPHVVRPNEISEVKWVTIDEANDVVSYTAVDHAILASFEAMYLTERWS
jgi:8-oxo-dGTP diphosphatase